jgi:hypothetical protein
MKGWECRPPSVLPPTHRPDKTPPPPPHVPRFRSPVANDDQLAFRTANIQSTRQKQNLHTARPGVTDHEGEAPTTSVTNSSPQGHDSLGAETIDDLPGSHPQSMTLIGIFHQTSHGLSQSRHIVWRNQNPVHSVANNIPGTARAICANDGKAAGHGLNQRHRKPFIPGGQHKTDLSGEGSERGWIGGRSWTRNLRCPIGAERASNWDRSGPSPIIVRDQSACVRTQCANA